MPIQTTHQLSDMEKRLKLLHMQLYGKSKEQKLKVESSLSQPPPTDLAFLKQDLLKILLLALLTMGAQLILYFSQLPNKIKLF